MGAVRRGRGGVVVLGVRRGRLGLARGVVLIALLVLAVGDLVVIAVARIALRAAVRAGRRVGIVLIVRPDAGHRLFVGVVRVIRDPVRGRVVLLVLLDVLLDGDPVIHLGRRRRRR